MAISFLEIIAVDGRRIGKYREIVENEEGDVRRNETMYIAYIEFKIRVAPFVILKCTIIYI